MNYVLIFKNDEGLTGCDQIDIEKLPENPAKIADSEIFLFDDDVTLETIESDFKEKRDNRVNSFYVVLHQTKQEKLKPDFLKEFGPNVICQHHMGGEFYFTIIPKLINGSLTSEEIKAFFPDQSLKTKRRLLIKLYSGVFELDENEKIILRKYNFNLDDYKTRFNSIDERNALIRELRDQLI